MATIRVEIGRLVLDGWPLGAREAALVRAAVEVELGRLFAAGPAPGVGAGGAVERVGGWAVAWQPGGDPAALGAGVAQAVYGSLGR